MKRAHKLFDRNAVEVQTPAPAFESSSALAGACAELGDGLFDVVGLENLSAIASARLTPYLYAGTHIGRPGVTYTRGKLVVTEPVRTSDHVLLDIDGEAPGRLPARFEMRAGAMLLRG